MPRQDTVKFECCHCGQPIEAPAEIIGVEIECPGCGKTVKVPPPPQKPFVLPLALIVTTGNDVSGRTIESYIGIARGIVVRSPDLIQGMIGGLKQIVGGNIETYARVCEETRRLAFCRMVAEALEMNANAVIAMRYDATEFAPGITEVLAYGTAVKLAAPEKERD